MTGFRTGLAGHPFRHFVVRDAELMLEIGLGKPVAAFFGGSHYERLSEASPGR